MTPVRVDPLDQLLDTRNVSFDGSLIPALLPQDLFEASHLFTEIIIGVRRAADENGDCETDAAHQTPQAPLGIEKLRLQSMPLSAKFHHQGLSVARDRSII